MLLTNFAAGELSPLLSGRVDMQLYYSAAGRIENFSVIPTGGIRRRCGTSRMGQLHGFCRLIPFILDKDTSFIFECVANKMYVWKNGAKMLDTSGSQMYISTAWTSLAEIREVQYAQNYDTMIFVQRGYAPLEVKYSFGYGTFTSAEMTFDFSPDVEIDDDYEYVKIVTDTALPASGAFDGQYATLKGKLYKWSAADTKWTQVGTDPDIDTDLFTTTGKYPGCVSFYNNRLWFASTESERQKVWASSAPDTDGNRYNEFSPYVKYITVEKVVKEADLHVFTGTVASGATTITGITQNLTGLDTTTDYFISQDDCIAVGTKVLSATWDSTKKTGTLTIDTASTAEGTAKVFTVQLWRYPTTATADDYEYQVTANNVTTADNSLYFELASDQNDSVKWMAQNNYLIIGTESSEWVIPSSVNALSVSAALTSRHGSDDIQATCVDSAVIFFAQGKRGIREYYWNDDAGAFRANNIAMSSAQMLTESAAVDFDFMTNPYSRLIVTRADGTVAVMLYEKNSGVAAWYRFTTEGTVVSCAVTRGDAGSDYVYMAVKRGNDYYLERFDEDVEVYLDSFASYSGSDGEYTSSAVLFDETQGVQYALTDTSAIAPGDTVYIGYPYASRVVSMPVVGSDPTGKKRITDLLIRFYESYKPEMVCDDSTEEFTDFTEPYSGVKTITYPGNTDRDVTFTLQAAQPRPCTILAINAGLA